MQKQQQQEPKKFYCIDCGREITKENCREHDEILKKFGELHTCDRCYYFD